MLRAWKPILVLALAGLCTGGLTLPGLARDRIGAAIRERCLRSLGTTCTVGAVQLALDGALVRDLRARTVHGDLTLRVDRVAVRIGWTGLLLGREAGVELRVAGVELRAGGSLERLLQDLQRPAPAETSGGHRRLRLQRLRVEEVSLEAGPFDVGGTALRAGLHHGSAAWERDGRTDARWSEATVQAGSLGEAQSGECLVVRGADAHLVVDCTGFAASVDVGALAPALRLAEALARLHPGATVPRRAGDVSVAEGPPPAVTDLRIHDGRMRLLHGTDTVADVTPAGLVVSLAGASLRSARLDLGDAHGGQPSLGVELAPGPHGWRVDLDADALPLSQLAPWVPSVPWHGPETGLARAHVHVEPLDATGAIDVQGALSLENFGLAHAGLAREPLDGLNLDVRGGALIEPARRRVASQGVSVRLNGIPFTVAGWVERDATHTALDASLRVPDVECDALRRSLPRAATGPVGGFLFSGTLGGNVHVALDTRRLAATVLDFALRDGCAVAHSALEVNLHRLGGPFVQRVQEPGGVVRTFVAGPGTPAWVSLDAIGPLVTGAVLTREDGGFYRHHGFSPDEVRGALVRNVGAGHFVYGASTLTMQLVKNIFLAREKTLVRKLQEVALTWWLEQSLDKDSILELYLNVVEFGPGIYGIGPAARFFFGREPRDLTAMQAAYLATLLPSPIQRFVLFERGQVPPESLARLRAIVRTMAANHFATPVDVAAAATETLTFRARSAPVPGAQTLTVDPATTDDMALSIAQSQGVRPAADEPAGEPVPDAPASGDNGY